MFVVNIWEIVCRIKFLFLQTRPVTWGKARNNLHRRNYNVNIVWKWQGLFDNCDLICFLREMFRKILSRTLRNVNWNCNLKHCILRTFVFYFGDNDVTLILKLPQASGNLLNSLATTIKFYLSHEIQLHCLNFEIYRSANYSFSKFRRRKLHFWKIRSLSSSLRFARKSHGMRFSTQKKNLFGQLGKSKVLNTPSNYSNETE